MKTILAVLAVASLSLAACGDDDNNNGASGVAKDKKIVDYTSDDAKKMCDWAAGQLGGYGHAPCGGTGAIAQLLAPITASQQMCSGFLEAAPSTCQATTATAPNSLENCIKNACNADMTVVMQACGFMAACVPTNLDGGADASNDASND